jgi:signal transduction histidine kinase
MAEVGASLAIPILAPRPIDETRGGQIRADAAPDVLGALFVDDERLLEPFSREEVELFEGLAAQAAITLQNSKVYERRKERERLAALGEMAAGLAHEIRNPLGAIKGAVQVVEPQMAKMSESTNEFLGVIVEEVDRLNRVVTQFLSYSRPYTGEMRPVDLGEVVQATLRLLDPERAERVTVDLVAPPRVRGDAEALRQVLLNLVLNGLDATGGMEPKGRVWIDVGTRRRGLSTGDAVTVTVRDNGPGLSPHTLTNLFVPFHTTKSGGTGLGLPISQRIVENHGGLIEVGNGETGGARFTVLLPHDEG